MITASEARQIAEESRNNKVITLDELDNAITANSNVGRTQLGASDFSFRPMPMPLRDSLCALGYKISFSRTDSFGWARGWSIMW